MTTFNNAEVLARMNRALSGEGAGDEQAELPVQAYAWRMLRWEADIPCPTSSANSCILLLRAPCALRAAASIVTTRTR